MAPRTIAICTNGVDPVSPIRDDQIGREVTASARSQNSDSNHGTGRSLNTRSTGQFAVRSSSAEGGIMMDPAEIEAWRRLGGDSGSDIEPMDVVTPAPARSAIRTARSSATAATAEETITTRSTSSGSVSTGTRQLRQSVKQREQELMELKTKYEEAKSKMSKMKEEKSSNKKMLLEMSGLIKALQDISVDYEQSEDSNDNKDGSRSSSSSKKNRHKAHLQNIQRKIQAIDTQMRAAKTQCGLLKEEKSLHASTIKAQESQISALQDQINLLCKRLEQSTQSNTQDQAKLQNIIHLQETQIMSLEGQISLLKRNADERRITSIDQQNAARYQEISSLEGKLAALREAQNAHKIQASTMRSLSKSQDCQEEPVQDMSDDIFEEDEEDEPPKKKSSASSSTSKSNKASFGKSARNKNKSVSFGNLSVTSGSLAAISEECENNSEYSDSMPEASATSTSETTDDTNTTSLDDTSTDSSSETPSAEDGAESTMNVSSTFIVEPSEDESSVEIMEALPKSTGDVETTKVVEEDSDRDKVLNGTKSSHSSRIDFMDDIKKEKDEIDDGSSTLCDEAEKEERYDCLLRELQETKAKYGALKEDYRLVLSNTTTKIDQLEQENQELRDCRHGLVLRTAQAIDTANSVNDITKLREVNEQLRKKLAKQDAMLSFTNTKYENLRTEHSQTILELKGNAAKQEDMFSSDSNMSGDVVVDIETYTRLEKVHEAVVMKLADLGEENDRLERERNIARQQLENMHSQLQSNDDSFFELQKLKASYTLLEEERDAIKSKLERMKDRNVVLQGSSDDTSRLRKNLADALARIEVLEKTNEEFGDVETKLTASEVRVSILEGELEKASAKLKAAKKKQSERESQIREVIGQYKTLKGNYLQSQARMKRLESIIESDQQTATKTTKKDGVSESARTDRTSSSAEFSATRFAAMNSQLAAYEGQINKLQKQRDAAMEQMKEMEGELDKAKKEIDTAAESKKSRERDLRIVLQHYEKLQKKYEATSKEFEEMTQKYEEAVKEINVLEEQINGKCISIPQQQECNDKCNNEESAESNDNVAKNEVNREIATTSTNASNNQCAAEIPGGKPTQMDDENSIDQLLDEMEQLKHGNCKLSDSATKGQNEEAEDIRSIAGSLPPNCNPASSQEQIDLFAQLEEAKESSTWKNEKVARILCELKAAQDQIETLEEEKARMQSDLNILKGQLLIAQKESSNAKERQENREVNLRNAIAKHHRLQQQYVSLEVKFEEVKQMLEAAQKDSKIREEEAKEARQRASGVHAQFKRLQVDHSAVLDRLERLNQELEMYKATPDHK
ncbi:hypothetical protein IV203_015059 [Nitzschia inconspicua]|uniref:Uncharacterized protein n=1 Tax=Nitzschia inconspicua TaxID=303405 RepID=A0A9K3LD04_9STRA|nr:hypothetical protein IV203_015059 [Nitzschia inconspicua]